MWFSVVSLRQSFLGGHSFDGVVEMNSQELFELEVEVFVETLKKY